MVPPIAGLGDPLHVLVGCANQKVSKIDACFRGAIIKHKIPVDHVGELLIHLVLVKAAPKHQRVRSHYLAEVVQDLPRVLDVTIGAAGHTHREGVKVQLGHALYGRIQYINTEGVRTGCESQRTHCGAAPIRGLVHQNIIADILRTELR